ncbi:MAG: winged helix-turn-helix transcriptional regulator [Alphaproteobacteria bacterium]|nr:winged helix-turn-helix transcriptional regulator [Alphaproteobacteria bacterium]
MTRIKLDKIDLKILKELQENGRITNVELAKKAGISAPPCLRRVRQLEELGIITGYHADLNGAMLGYGITVFAHVKLNSQSDAELKKFMAEVCGWAEVREAWTLTGEDDVLLKIVAKSWEGYHALLVQKLTPLANVKTVRSSLAVTADKSVPGVPVDVE